ncbi:hypothetical protein C8R45DRAFT_1000967 [Mycena sanguinolenta]|nr:hypothetical protein C8R45DRAFT_1000967 [Mycena sanguinolenta]
MLFHDLYEDVLAHILLLCDAYTVISFLRVNKFFRRLALSKQLWLALVLDLSSRYFIPHLHTLQDCSTIQLIAKVKCLMCGPETWSQQSSVQPAVSFSKLFPGGRQPRFLPGGRYFAAVRPDCGDLQCRNVLTGRCVWTHVLGASYTTTSWEIEMLDDGHTARYLFFEVSTLLMKPSLSIVEVDLQTGQSNQLFRLELNRDAGRYGSPVVSGEFVAVGLTAGSQRMIVLINWREGKYVVFEGSNVADYSGKDHMAFVPGHIILATAASKPPNNHLIVVHTLHSIASRWRPLEELLRDADLPADNIRILPEGTSPIVVERLQHNNHVFVSPSRGLHIKIMLHANPIRNNAYKLMVYASDNATNTFHQSGARGTNLSVGAVLFTYAINLRSSEDYGLSWTRTSAFLTEPDIITFPLSYARYAVISSRNSSGSTTTRIVDPRLMHGFRTKWAGQAMREVTVVGEGPVVATLSSTGLILVSRQSRIEISCYT